MRMSVASACADEIERTSKEQSLTRPLTQLVPTQLDQNFVGLVDDGLERNRQRSKYRFEVEADWRAVAHTLRESLRIRQDTDCAQRLRVAFQQDTLSRISAERGRSCFLPKAQLYKIQIGIDFGGLQMLSLLLFHIGTERIQHAIGNGIVRRLGRTIVIN